MAGMTETELDEKLFQHGYGNTKREVSKCTGPPESISYLLTGQGQLFLIRVCHRIHLTTAIHLNGFFFFLSTWPQSFFEPNSNITISWNLPSSPFLSQN
jgi:hypothetical protein